MSKNEDWITEELTKEALNLFQKKKSPSYLNTHQNSGRVQRSSLFQNRVRKTITFQKPLDLYHYQTIKLLSKNSGKISLLEVRRQP